MSEPLLKIQDLKKRFRVTGWMGGAPGFVHALRGVNLEVRRGTCLGLVGESGSGKSTLARCALQLQPYEEGSVSFEGVDLSTVQPEALRQMRKHFQMIFQDPYASLNPRLRVDRMLREVLTVHRVAQGLERERRIQQLLEDVGLRGDMAQRYPHEFSGGQRQRLGIARALAVEPKLIVADEPVSALDVSVQAQILNLLMDLRRDRGLTYILIAHDLKVVERLSDEIAVLYLGSIVEKGPAYDLVRRPQHPYTRALLAAVPRLRGHEDAGAMTSTATELRGEIPSPRNPPGGCAFHPRCPLAEPRCSTEPPHLRKTRSGWDVACHLVE